MGNLLVSDDGNLSLEGIGQLSATVRATGIVLDLANKQTIDITIDGAIKIFSGEYAQFADFVAEWESSGQNQAMLNELLQQMILTHIY